MKNNKLVLSLGATVAIVAPIATIISCGKEKTRHFDLLPTYTGQADQLIALGIHSDYYPLQLNADTPYEYLTNPGQFMTQQKPEFKDKFAKALKNLMPSTKGISWWNQQALDSDEQGSDPSYWTKQEGGLLLYEHYLLDDDAKIIDNQIAPNHDPAATIQTNFRASRDPYTRIPKGVFYAWDMDIKDLEVAITANTPKTIDSVLVSVDELKIAKELKELDVDSEGESGWSFNDKYFVDFYHRMFLDNDDFQNSDFAKWLIDSTSDNPFGTAIDTQQFADNVKKLFDASTFQADEIGIGIGPYSQSAAVKHHPIYEQQEGEIGAAPMFEGAMRDNQLYLFNVAWQMTNIATYGTPYGQQHFNEIPPTITKDKRDSNLKVAQSQEEAEKVKAYLVKQLGQAKVNEMKLALPNAKKITTQLKSRMENIKKYIDVVKTKVNHSGDLTFGVFTIAPGHGESTLQSMSKYSFLYKELGFKQPAPNNLDSLASGAEKFTKAWDKTKATNKYLTDGIINGSDATVKEAIGAGSLFNMDDNGWFWTLGESGKLSPNYMKHFEGNLDLGVIASKDDNFNSEIKKDKSVNAPSAAKMFDLNIADKDAVQSLENRRVDYDLWNEGIKTPFVMHMVLDQVIGQVNTWAKVQDTTFDAKIIAEHSDAINWGDYFTKEFVKNVK